ncbi:hypothetical protein A6V36_33420 [Paraburkholderia ginsengiterrae]|uniref:Uncharacterized protein n=1 Tax=Paraburkholderia ginsengiterrae TaxID=1462993 RepID=A0A1A9N2H5_9BURK|nr:hypothetical protein A6V37_31705 [Paraburkholderia ginsengiterrae]OAJ56627.1 hypothetical protein A6V36_33420 [Paraburkholderia ginsengiterrae]
MAAEARPPSVTGAPKRETTARLPCRLRGSQLACAGRFANNRARSAAACAVAVPDADVGLAGPCC